MGVYPGRAFRLGFELCWGTRQERGSSLWRDPNDEAVTHGVLGSFHREAPAAGIRLPGGGLGSAGAFQKRWEPFWATLEWHRRRETVLPLARNTSVAMQQRPCTERARHLFSADRGRNSHSPKAH